MSFWLRQDFELPSLTPLSAPDPATSYFPTQARLLRFPRPEEPKNCFCIPDFAYCSIARFSPLLFQFSNFKNNCRINRRFEDSKFDQKRSFETSSKTGILGRLIINFPRFFFLSPRSQNVQKDPKSDS